MLSCRFRTSLEKYNVQSFFFYFEPTNALTILSKAMYKIDIITTARMSSKIEMRPVFFKLHNYITDKVPCLRQNCTY